MTFRQQGSKPHFLIMIALIISGEAIFFLPFVLPRVFRPTLLSVFDISNYALGLAFSVYGIIAMISYFFGGLLADRFKARHMMAAALIATALGGIFLYTIPNASNFKILYGFWGLTTILLFWAALMKATRAWGGKDFQGQAFGYLDGGRGAIAALIGISAVYIFDFFLPLDVEAASPEAFESAFKMVILFTSLVTLLVAVFVWVVMPAKQEKSSADRSTIKGLGTVFKSPGVWLQSLIVLCAYVGYKIIDDFSLFAKEILHFNDLEAAKIGATLLWLRPAVAIIIALTAHRFKISYAISIGFLLTVFGSALVGFNLIPHQEIWFYIIALIITGTGVFACRSLYFAVMGEAKVPLHLTGTTVGVVSMLGFTPEIFVGPVMGIILDSGVEGSGHFDLFLLLALFSFLGFIASITFSYINNRKTHFQTNTNA